MNEVLEQIKTLFPVKVKVTQQIIDESDVLNPRHCIGANTLRTVVKEGGKTEVSWGIVYGHVWNGVEWLKITTVEKIKFTKVKEPVEVTFVVEENCYAGDK